MSGLNKALHAGLLVNWKLDETSGTTATDSAAGDGSQNGTSAAATPQWIPTGILGGALRFSPTLQADVDEAVSFTNGTTDLIPAYPVTMSSWVRMTSTAGFRETFVFLGDHLAGSEYLQTSKEPSNAGTNPSRAVAAARNTSFFGAIGGPVVNDGQWHQVVGVYDSATSRTVYVDGKQVGTNTTSVAMPNTTRLSIGALMRSSPTDSFNGDLDDVGLWDVSLSPQRIALLNGLGRFSSVSLSDPSIDNVELVFNNQSGQAQSGSLTWKFASSLPSTVIGTTGTLGDGSPYIVLSSTGSGVQAVPEPATLGLLGFGALGLLRRRQRVRCPA